MVFQSLNKALLAGPVIQPKLTFYILMKFWSFAAALTGDIWKMCRCVRIMARDNYYQSIVWRDSLKEELSAFKLDPGTKPASFLSEWVMHQLAEGKRIFSISEVINKMQQTSKILFCANFKLRKWCFGERCWRGQGAVLWREWLNQTKKPSKRSILSTIAHIYDHLGLIGPAVAICQIFLQQLWNAELNWDKSLPLEVQSTWMDIPRNCVNVTRLTYPRLVLNPTVSMEACGAIWITC